MRNSILVLLVSLCVDVLAASFEVPRESALARVESSRQATVLREGRALFPLADGSLWVTHPAPAEREPSALAVTRFGEDGSARVFLVSDWLPKGTIPRGRCGQVYAVALMDDGRLAASAGWTDGRQSHNGIFVLRVREDGTHDTDHLIKLPGVARIAGGPGNTILAVTSDASRENGGPLVTLFSAEGRVLGSLLEQSGRFSPAEAARNASSTILQRVSDTQFALYDPTGEQVFIFDVDRAGSEMILTPRRIFFIGDDASTANVPVLGIETWPNGDLLVVRSGRIRGAPGTQLTVYKRDHSVKQTAVLDRPWNAMFREKNRIRGVVLRGEVRLDNVLLRDD